MAKIFSFILSFLFCSAAFADRISLQDGTALEVVSKCPDGNRQPLPVIALFGGFETGAKAIDLIGSQADFCLVTFQYPFEGPGRFKAWDAVKYLPKAKRALHNTIEGMNALVDWIRKNQRFDSERIIFVGASFGAPFVSYAAADRTEVAGLILVHGFADVENVIAHRLGEKWTSKYGLAGYYFAQLFAKFLWWYADVKPPEAALEKLREHQTVLLLTAEGDDMLPASATEKLRNAVERSRAKWREKRMPGAHLRPGETELVQKLLQESLIWLRAQEIITSASDTRGRPK